MKVYRIKHKPSGLYYDKLNRNLSDKGTVYTDIILVNASISYLKNNPDYEILYDEIKD